MRMGGSRVYGGENVVCPEGEESGETLHTPPAPKGTEIHYATKGPDLRALDRDA